MRSMDEGELRVVDARLRRVGEWLLVGYTVAMVLVTFVLPERQATSAESPNDGLIQLFVG